MKQLVKENHELNKVVADEDFETAISESRLLYGLTAKKIYGNAIYLCDKKIVLTKDELSKIEEIQKFFHVNKKMSSIESLTVTIENPYSIDTDEEEEKYDAFEEKLNKWNDEQEESDIKIKCDYQEGLGYRSRYNMARNIDSKILKKLNPLIKMLKEWKE